MRATMKATPTTMTARTADTVGDVKKFAVQKHKGLPVEKQALILGDRLLEDQDLVSDYGLKENQVVALSTSIILYHFTRSKL